MAEISYITIFGCKFRREDVVAAIELVGGRDFSVLHTDATIIREINKMSDTDLDEFRGLIDEVKE